MATVTGASVALLITGASSGIGRAMAELYREQGRAVLNVSRRPCTVSGVVNLQADLADPKWLDGCLEGLVEFVQENPVVNVVHNAGVLEGGALGTVPMDGFRRAMEINVTAAVALNQAVLPALREGSSIVYVGSTLSEKAVAGSHAYVTSKHAVIGLMRATCQDLAGKGIHTVCVCPGFTDTEMLRSHLPDTDVRHQVASGNAFGRLAEPVEIARVMKFCAETPVLNGAVIHANLGQIER